SGKRFSSKMTDHSKALDLSNLNLQDNNDIISRADKQAEILHRFSQLAEKIQPRLTIDGANFNTWSRNMIETWVACFMDDGNYFDITDRDPDHRRNLIALSFIRNSTERALFESVTSRIIMPNARKVYQAIKNRFSKSSWSSIIRHATTIFNPTDQSHDIIKHAISLGETIQAIESQLGPLDSNKVMTLSLFFSVPTMQSQITAALDTRLAANPNLQINMEDILDIIQQVSNSPKHSLNNDDLQLSKIDTSRVRPLKGKSRIDGQHIPPPHTPSPPPNSFSKFNPSYSSSPISQRPEGWKKKWLTPQNPCFYCGEAGHWAPECPARTKAARARLHSTQPKPNVASLGAVPLLENNEALLDSGATHSVMPSGTFTYLHQKDP
ncbi:hypothetical protein O181_113989, partial [Austropuccinia psidii MF-1]|nr:hypothetical protein [Austropuccinia psidii MF-1]